MADNKVLANSSDEYEMLESFWSGSPSMYHTRILRSGVIISKDEILRLYSQARGLFFLPSSGLKKFTGDKVCDIIISLHLGADIFPDQEMNFGFIWKY